MAAVFSLLHDQPAALGLVVGGGAGASVQAGAGQARQPGVRVADDGQQQV